MNFTTSQAPSMSGKLYYDYPNKCLRMDTSMFGQPDIELELYSDNTRYSYAEGQCKVRVTTGSHSISLDLVLPPSGFHAHLLYPSGRQLHRHQHC